jgi:hypothetical protein
LRPRAKVDVDTSARYARREELSEQPARP